MSDMIQYGLKKPFPLKAVHWRVGSTTKDKDKGMALAYIDARDVMKRLDDVCGIGGWQARYPTQFDGTLICELGIKIDGEWVWKSDGAGATDYEGEKGKVSDAFKRAAVHWGVGRYLYQLGSEWVPIKAQGRSYVVVTPPKMPDWATPEGFSKYAQDPLIAHNEALREHIVSIASVKTFIAADHLSSAMEAWDEIDEPAQRALWFATTKGGILTTEERRIMRSNEWLAIAKTQTEKAA